MIQSARAPWPNESALWIVLVVGLACGFYLGALLATPRDLPVRVISRPLERVQPRSRPKSRPMTAPRVLAAGIASWYDLPGNLTASGVVFRSRAHMCAMRYVAFGTRVRILNLDNKRTAHCTVRDRGPFVPGRVIDVSPVVRDELGMGGLAPVKVFAQ